MMIIIELATRVDLSWKCCRAGHGRSHLFLISFARPSTLWTVCIMNDDEKAAPVDWILNSRVEQRRQQSALHGRRAPLPSPSPPLSYSPSTRRQQVPTGSAFQERSGSSNSLHFRHYSSCLFRRRRESRSVTVIWYWRLEWYFFDFFACIRDRREDDSCVHKTDPRPHSIRDNPC